MNPAEIVLSLIFVATLLAALAHKVGIAYPTVLVLGGLVLSFMPGLPIIRLPPEVVFLVFLPPLIYLPASQVALYDFRRSWGAITLLSIGLVLFTLVGVAVLIQYMLPTFSWSTAFLLAAIVAPTDMIAVNAITRRMPIPHGVNTILGGESMFNDVVAFVAYKMALAAVVTGVFSVQATIIELIWDCSAGIAAGMVVGLLAVWVRRRVHDAAINSALSLLTAFVSYLAGETIHASGILATVTTGLYVGRCLSKILEPEDRQGSFSFWAGLNFILEGLAFILIGLELRPIIVSLGQVPLSSLVWYATLISAAVLVLRFVWILGITAVGQLTYSYWDKPGQRPRWNHAVIVAWSGIRGVDSLAAALGVPLFLQDGSTPFPERDLILFLSFSVILVTLLLQGSTLPWLIQTLDVKDDRVIEHEEALARRTAAQAALEELQHVDMTQKELADLVLQLREVYQRRIKHYQARLDRVAELPFQTVFDSSNALRFRLLKAERDAVIALHEDGFIGSAALRRVERSLDFEELRLASTDSRASGTGS